MAQQKTVSAPNAPQPTQEGKTSSPVGETALTKREGVRRALADLGKDAKPLRIKDYVKDKFGIDISASVVSFYKKDLKKRKKGASKAKAAPAKTSPKAAPKTAVKKATAKLQKRTAPAARANGIGLDDVRTVKALVGRVGADNLRKLIDLVAK
jgi:hypothetical protein